MTLLTIRNAVLAALFAPALASAKPDSDFNATDGPNVRVLRHDDGTRTMFQRSPDNTALTTKTFTPNGTLQMLTIYRMDKAANPLSCKIYDGQKVELFKIRYGYRKSDGQLVEEQMFDSRVKRKTPGTDEERPVRRLIYTYDANGKRSAPMAINIDAGQKAEDVFKIKPFVPEDNPLQKVPLSSQSGAPNR